MSVFGQPGGLMGLRNSPLFLQWFLNPLLCLFFSQKNHCTLSCKLHHSNHHISFHTAPPLKTSLYELRGCLTGFIRNSSLSLSPLSSAKKPLVSYTRAASLYILPSFTSLKCPFFGLRGRTPPGAVILLVQLVRPWTCSSWDRPCSLGSPRKTCSVGTCPSPGARGWGGVRSSRGVYAKAADGRCSCCCSGVVPGCGRSPTRLGLLTWSSSWGPCLVVSLMVYEREMTRMDYYHLLQFLVSQKYM